MSSDNGNQESHQALGKPDERSLSLGQCRKVGLLDTDPRGSHGLCAGVLLRVLFLLPAGSCMILSQFGTSNFFMMASLSQDSSAIQFIHLQMGNEQFSVCPQNCGLWSILEYVHHPEKKFCTLQRPPPKSSQHSQALAPINLLSAFKDVPILDTSYKLNHTTCGLVCLASFTLMFSRVIHVAATK